MNEINSKFGLFKNTIVLMCILFPFFSVAQRGKYKKACEQNTIESYQEFLNNNPGSKYTQDIKFKSFYLEISKAIEENNVNGYEKFLEKYPASLYSNLFIDKIELINMEQLLPEIYVNEVKNTTIENIFTFKNNYFDKYKNTDFIKKITPEIEYNLIANSENNSFFELRRYIDRFPDSKFTKDIKNLLEIYKLENSNLDTIRKYEIVYTDNINQRLVLKPVDTSFIFPFNSHELYSNILEIMLDATKQPKGKYVDKIDPDLFFEWIPPNTVIQGITLKGEDYNLCFEDLKVGQILTSEYKDNNKLDLQNLTVLYYAPITKYITYDYKNFINGKFDNSVNENIIQLLFSRLPPGWGLLNDTKLVNIMGDIKIRHHIETSKSDWIRVDSKTGLKLSDVYNRWEFDTIRLNIYEQNISYRWNDSFSGKLLYGNSLTSIRPLNLISEYPDGKYIVDQRDGKKYKTMRIGNYIWMTQNLNYNIDGSLCYYLDSLNCEKLGRLYNYEVSTKVCPDNWHLADTWEWNDLLSTLWPMHNYGELYPSAYDYLLPTNLNLVLENKSGFSILPSGLLELDGQFIDKGNSAWYWADVSNSGSNNEYIGLHVKNDKLLYVTKGEYSKFGGVFKKFDYFQIVAGEKLNRPGFSVRCVRDY